MSRLQTLFLASCLLLASCAGGPNIPEPEGEECRLNLSSSEPVNWYKLCFQLKDYDSDLKLKKGVKGVRKPVTAQDLHGSFVYDPDSRGNLKAYVLKWKAYFQEKSK